MKTYEVVRRRKGGPSWWRRAAPAVLIAVIIALTQTLTVQPALAQRVDGFGIFQTFMRDGRTTQLCLDIAGGSNDNGAQVVLWTCHDGLNQLWYREGDTLRSKMNGKCLDVTGAGSFGAKLQMWDCNGYLQQSWTQVNAQVNFSSYLVAKHNSQCLDVPSNQWYAGQRLQVWECNGTAAQRFIVW